MPNKSKIFESPDGGKTVYEREFNSPHSSRKLTTGEKVYGYHPQELLTAKILPIDIFYKLFGKKHEWRRWLHCRYGRF